MFRKTKFNHFQPLPQESGDQEDEQPEDACGESPTATEAVPWFL